MTNYYVLASPLQCMFASLIANQLGSKNVILYYNYGKTFIHTYRPIIATVNADVSDIIYLPDFDISTVHSTDNLFISNRFNPDDIKIVHQLKNRVKEINLFEDGSNTYLTHHYVDKKFNDTNIKKRVRNLLNYLEGKPQTHIYLSQFTKAYTSFPLKTKVKENILVQFINNTVSGDNIEPNSCLFLSQTLAVDGFLSFDEYHNWLLNIVADLLQKHPTLYYKPHPRDNKETLILITAKFGERIKFLPEFFAELPCELFLIQNPTLTLYGFFSSTLIYFSSLMKGNSNQLLSAISKSFPTYSRLQEVHHAMNDLFIEHNIKQYEK